MNSVTNIQEKINTKISEDYFIAISHPEKIHTIYSTFGKIDYEKFALENFIFIDKKFTNQLNTIDDCYFIWIANHHPAKRCFALHRMVSLIKERDDLKDFMDHCEGKNLSNINIPLMFHIAHMKYNEIFFYE